MDDTSCSSTAPSTSIQHWLTVRLPNCTASCYNLLVSLFCQCCALYLMNWACSSLCWCYDAVLVWHGCQILPSDLGSPSSCYNRTMARLKVMKSLHAALEATGWWPRNLGLNCGRTKTVLCYPWHHDQLWGLLVAYLVGTGGVLPVWEEDIFLSSNSVRTNAAIPLSSWCAELGIIT